MATRLQKYYEGFASERESALHRLGEHFTDDIHFRDPFRETHGMPAFRELFVRMFKQYPTVAFDSFRIDGDDRAFTLTYVMRLGMVVGPEFVTPMASVCRVRAGEDRVSDLLDFYDFSSSLVSPFPLVAAAYRKLVNALFL
ncbi:MAG: nuclear transport factor 2 family protein [Labilithrix sp.]|nr:nuclear transport factor 2 family protein [Labilithrix sp.]MCW5809437.1 nuclear transport factor 2 family protein [Labilithrix sp.]